MVCAAASFLVVVRSVHLQLIKDAGFCMSISRNGMFLCGDWTARRDQRRKKTGVREGGPQGGREEAARVHVQQAQRLSRTWLVDVIGEVMV